MPHVSSDAGGDDLCSSDEVKVFKDEGEEKRSSENLNELTEEQHDLIDLSESEVSDHFEFFVWHIEYISMSSRIPMLRA